MTMPINPKQVAATNPGVDVAKINEAVAFGEVLKKAGLLQKANYRLSPALGPTASRPGSADVRLVRMSKR
jgi:hypothetical protein